MQMLLRCVYGGIHTAGNCLDVIFDAVWCEEAFRLHGLCIFGGGGTGTLEFLFMKTWASSGTLFFVFCGGGGEEGF